MLIKIIFKILSFVLTILLIGILFFLLSLVQAKDYDTSMYSSILTVLILLVPAIGILILNMILEYYFTFKRIHLVIMNSLLILTCTIILALIQYFKTKEIDFSDSSWIVTASLLFGIFFPLLDKGILSRRM